MACTNSPDADLFSDFTGERWDHVVSQGGMWGPFEATMYGPPDEDDPIQVARGYGDEIDLTGCSVFGNVRKKANSASVTATIETEVLNQVTDKGRYDFWITSDDMASIPAGETVKSLNSQYVWDLWLRDAAGEDLRLYFGDFAVLPRVTRANP
jgi:hypothetical protein